MIAAAGMLYQICQREKRLAISGQVHSACTVLALVIHWRAPSINLEFVSNRVQCMTSCELHEATLELEKLYSSAVATMHGMGHHSWKPATKAWQWPTKEHQYSSCLDAAQR